MNDSFNKAEWWKCALQVNPWSYSKKYRAQVHGYDEDAYNQALVEECKKHEVALIAVTDHGSVAGYEKIADALKPEGIVVLPGFEMTTSEKIHLICLFPESTDPEYLRHYLRDLGVEPGAQGHEVTDTAAAVLLDRVDRWGGLTYAAHCHEDNGVLHRRCYHVWKNPRLKAAQIKAGVEDLKNSRDLFYYRILSNQDPNYDREGPIALINAADVKDPADLARPGTTCFVKMTRPSFESLKHAFEDPEGRVRLDGEELGHHASAILGVEFVSGFLAGVKADLSPELNTLIGGRGTGKSTFLEGVRFALELEPDSEAARKRHDKIVRANLGSEGGMVKLKVRSAALHGKSFQIRRKWGDSATVTDLDTGQVSRLAPRDLLPDVECFGHNEIHEIIRDSASRALVLERFLALDDSVGQPRFDELRAALKENREALIRAREEVDAEESNLLALQKIEEQLDRFKELGLEAKLEGLSRIENEKSLVGRFKEERQTLDSGLQTLRDSIPEAAFLNETALAELPSQALLSDLRQGLEGMATLVRDALSQLDVQLGKASSEADKLIKKLEEQHRAQEQEAEKAFQDIPDSQGKTGREIGTLYKGLIQKQQSLKPTSTRLDARKRERDALRQRRKQMLEEWKETSARKADLQRRSLRKLNKKLAGKLKVDIRPEAQRNDIVRYLLEQDLHGVGESRLKWVLERDEISPRNLAQILRSKDEQRLSSLGATCRTVQALLGLDEPALLGLEELDVPDELSLQLNVKHDPAEPDYRDIDELSSGQQCTALLHLLLLDNRDPLIIDQPEDNLDNAFIADRIVTELQQAKSRRQFLFATHNANIPVFGGADWIGVLSVGDDGKGKLPASQQGSVDDPAIQKLAADILEGGKAAFLARQRKYGFETES